MRLTDDDELYYDHPILWKKNVFEKSWGRAWHKRLDFDRKDRRYMKQKANQKARRAIKRALKGHNPRIKKMPGDSWEVW